MATNQDITATNGLWMQATVGSFDQLLNGAGMSISDLGRSLFNAGVSGDVHHAPAGDSGGDIHHSGYSLAGSIAHGIGQAADAIGQGAQSLYNGVVDGLTTQGPAFHAHDIAPPSHEPQQPAASHAELGQLSPTASLPNLVASNERGGWSMGA